MYLFDFGGVGGTCFIGYLLYLENRITLCDPEYELPVPYGCKNKSKRVPSRAESTFKVRNMGHISKFRLFKPY